MCKFFSFVTEPDNHPNQRFYFDWADRQNMTDKGASDSHDHIITFYKLYDERCNAYEYNPLTKIFAVDKQNSEIDDRVQAEKWVRKLNFKKIVEPLIIKPIINPLKLKKVERITEKHKSLLKEWSSVWSLDRVSAWSSARSSVGDSVWSSVWFSAKPSVWSLAMALAGSLVWDSVRALAGAYTSSFIDVKYEHDFSSATKLFEAGLAPFFDGVTWRLHSGEQAEVVFSITKKELELI